MKTPGLLIPPRGITPGPGRFLLPARGVLAAARTEDLLPLTLLAGDLARAQGCRCRTTLNAWGPAAVRVVRTPSIRGRDAYRLDVAPDGVRILAAGAPGIYYGVQTLRELVRTQGLRLPACTIKDRPDFARRGVYLDCSRGKVPTVDTLLALVEQLAAWKINELQLYIENVFTFRRHPAIGRGFSPFTPEELLRIQDHCRIHHVRLVPSLSSFGHFERVLHLPAYAALGEKPGYRGFRGGTTLCPSDPRSIRLVSELYDEFLPLFDAVDFNACCDETWELGKGRSRARAERTGVGPVYLDFIIKLHRLCQRHGKRMNLWADIILNHPELVKKVPSDLVLQNWDYEPDGSRIPKTRLLAAGRRPFLVCPGTSGWNTHGTRLDHAIRNVAVFAAEGRRRGAEGVLNTDWGDWGHRNTLGVSLHGLAHGAAHSWNGRAVADSSFTRRFCFHFFGPDSAPVVPVLRALGAATDRAGTALYHVLSEGVDPATDLFRGVPVISPVHLPPEFRGRRIDKASVRGTRSVLATLERVKDGLPVPGRSTPFVAQALKDLALAVGMDIMACRKILVARAARNGRGIARERRTLGRDIRTLARDFETCWRARNKPSRLKDNLRLFANAAEDLQ